MTPIETGRSPACFARATIALTPYSPRVETFMAPPERANLCTSNSSYPCFALGSTKGDAPAYLGRAGLAAKPRANRRPELHQPFSARCLVADDLVHVHQAVRCKNPTVNVVLDNRHRPPICALHGDMDVVHRQIALGRDDLAIHDVADQIVRRSSADRLEHIAPPEHADDPSFFDHRDTPRAACQGELERHLRRDSSTIPEGKLPDPDPAHHALD